MPSALLPSRFNRVSRQYTDASTTQGLRTSITTLLYPYLSAFSIGCWIRRSAAPASERIIGACGNYGTGGIGWGFRLETDGRVRLQELYTTTDKRRVNTTALTLDAWMYALARCSDTTNTASSTQDFVIDGVVDAGSSVSNGAGTHNAASTAQRFAVATSPTATLATSLPAAIGHVAIWDHRVHDLVGRDLRAGASPLDFAKGLIAYWPLDGRRGHGFEPDLSGFGYPLFPFSTAAPQWREGPPLVGRHRARGRIGYAPAGGGGATVLPDVGALILTGFAPTVLAPQTVLPGVGAATLTGFAPTILTPQLILPGVGAATLTGFSPTIVTPQTVATNVGALTLTGYEPTVLTGAGASPSVGALTLTGFSPTIIAAVAALPGVGVALLTGYEPTILTGAVVADNTAIGVARDRSPIVSVLDRSTAIRAKDRTATISVRDRSPGVAVYPADLSVRIKNREPTL